jgi:5'(3')-deoxyribonucleotidase
LVDYGILDLEVTVKIAIDFDDTIANTTPVFLHEFYQKNACPAPYQKQMEDIDCWDIELTLGVPNYVVRNTFNNLNYHTVEPMFGVKQAIERIADLNEIWVVTANPRLDKVKEWLNENGMGGLKVVFVPDWKAEYCYQQNFDVLIDDRWSTCHDFSAVYGGYALLMDKPWNKSHGAMHKNMSRVDSWEKITDLITKPHGIPFMLMSRQWARDTYGRLYGDNMEEVDDDVVTNENGAKQSRIEGRYDLMPALALKEIAKVLADGADKYGEDNWKGLSIDEINNHTFAHLLDYQQDANTDDLSHAGCRILMALQLHLEAQDA